MAVCPTSACRAVPERRRAEQTAQPSGGFHHIAKSVSRPLTGRGIRLLPSAESAVQLVAKPSSPPRPLLI
ncbi:MAG: hypothetical protein ACLSAH_04300 [Bilophila wadsworthia]